MIAQLRLVEDAVLHQNRSKRAIIFVLQSVELTAPIFFKQTEQRRRHRNQITLHQIDAVEIIRALEVLRPLALLSLPIVLGIGERIGLRGDHENFFDLAVSIFEDAIQRDQFTALELITLDAHQHGVGSSDVLIGDVGSKLDDIIQPRRIDQHDALGQIEVLQSDDDFFDEIMLRAFGRSPTLDLRAELLTIAERHFFRRPTEPLGLFVFGSELVILLDENGVRRRRCTLPKFRPLVLSVE